MDTEKTKRAPADKPPFTLKDLRNAIPKHCFERSLLRSSSFVAFDLAMVAALVWAALRIDALCVHWSLAWGVLWPAYWFWAGAFMWGLWVIGHECGHGAFSKYWLVNDAVGLVLHSAMLTPYFSWKHSHRLHHANTGHITKDQAFVPKMRSRVMTPDIDDLPFRHFALIRLLGLAFILIVGWPLYLTIHASGRVYPTWANHFHPNSPIFTKKERIEVVISDAGVAAVGYILFNLGKAFGWGFLAKMYLGPLLVVYFWLVLVTMLHHTHPQLPHYVDEEWDWLRGALSTVDRSYGFLDHIFHHITDTHVVHHLFSKMPHYHAKEATKYVKKILGNYYQRDNRSIIRAMWEDYSSCSYVAPDEPTNGVLWYRK